ncbi:MAG: copper ion binding protein [Candidatus Methanoperedens sp.]|nr:copper ion binding protein [Candidatus Methanoperedens sp.]
MSKIKKKPTAKGNIGATNPETIHVVNVITKFNVEGISLSDNIEKHVQKIQGVKKIDIDYETEEVEVLYDANITNFESIKKVIESQSRIHEEKYRNTPVKDVKNKIETKSNNVEVIRLSTHEANVTKKFNAPGISLSEDIEKHVRMIKGVKNIKIDYGNEEVQVIYDPNLTNLVSIQKVIESQGYICEEDLETTYVKDAQNKIKTKINNDEVTPVTIHEAHVTKSFKAPGISLSEDLEKHVQMLIGVKKINVDYEKEEVQVIYDSNITNFDSIKKAIESQCYIFRDKPVTIKAEKVIWTSSKAESISPDPRNKHEKKVIWVGSQAESISPDPRNKHVEKVLWTGSHTESTSPDPRNTHVKNVKNKIEPKINNLEGNPVTTYVANVIKKFKATGMTCKNCEKVIEKQVKTIAGVKNVDINFATEEVEVKYDPNKTNFNNIKMAIESKGYICEEYPATKSMSTTGWILLVLGIVVIAYYAIQSLEVIELPEISKDMSYGLLFIVGLLTGLHCVSMCGGFVVSYSTKGLAQGKKPHELHLAYGLGKTLSYTIIGAIFGLLGSIIAFTPLMRGMAGILAGLFLMLFGLKMLNIFPVLRNIQFKTPEFISKFTNGQKKNTSDPLKIGLLNGLMIACGPLQAIYIMAAGTGSMIEGAKLLFVFALGTLPVMLSFGYITSFLGSKATHQILKFSGAVVIILGIFMINNGLALTGAGIDLNPTTDNDLKTTVDSAPTSQQPIDVNTEFQEIKMEVNRAGYVPNKFDLKKGVPVKWIITGKEVTGCSNAIIVPSLGLEFKIKKGEQIIEFTPTKAGTIRWSCWMGMIQGSFNVK